MLEWFGIRNILQFMTQAPDFPPVKGSMTGVTFWIKSLPPKRVLTSLCHNLHLAAAEFEPPAAWPVACGFDHSATGSGGRH